VACLKEYKNAGQILTRNNIIVQKSCFIVNNVKAAAAKIAVFHTRAQKRVSKIMDSAN